MYHIQRFKPLFMYFALLKSTHPPSALLPSLQKPPKFHLTFSLSVICQRPRFKTLRQGSCVILSSPLLVIFVHPYRSMPVSCVKWSAISSSPLSVIRTH